MKTIQRIRIQNQNFVDAFLRRKRLVTFTELFIFVLIAIALVCTSCSPVLYTTVGQNVGLFHQKGEVSLSGNFASTNTASGGGFQFAAAVDSSTQVIASYYSLSSGSSSGDYFEFGAGKFSYSSANKFCGELILGLGLGSIKNSINGNSSSYYGGSYYTATPNYTVDANYIKPFIQPSFGISGKIGDIAFTPRIALVSYTNMSDNVTDATTRGVLDRYYSAKQNTVVFEPGVTLRLGFKNAKLQVQYNHTSFSYSSPDNFYPIDKEFVSVGLHLLISNRWLKTK